MSEYTDMNGWDEFSAYAYLNSAAGKKSINWPLTERVPLERVRLWIEASNPGPRFTKKAEDVQVVEPEPWPQQVGLSPIEAALSELADILRRKKADYSTGRDFANFEFASDTMGGDPTPSDVMRSLIGIKLGRIENLLNSENAPENESLLDSFRGLAGYAIILYAYWREVLDGS